MPRRLKDSLNVKNQCAVYKVRLWQCPQFLFIVMGALIIFAIFLTNILARAYGEPGIASIIVLGVAAAMFAVSHAIIKSFERLAEASRLKSEFIGILSHQIRTPLSSIKWQIESALSEGKNSSLDGGNMKFFGSIAEENQRLINIVNNFLEFRRIEDGDFVLRKDDFSMISLIHQAIEEVEKTVLAADTSITFLFPKEEIFMKADESRVKMVFLTLIDNALRYSIPYGSQKGEIAVAAEKTGNKIRISVADKGVGIPKEEAKYIFEKFFRVKNILKYKTQGFGIGLYVAKKIVESSGGKIGFKSSEGKGSVFWFTLPISNKQPVTSNQ